MIAAGMLFATAGLALLSGVHPGGSYVANVLPGGVLAALGLGLALVPATIVAVSGVQSSQSGLASGLLNTSRLIGGALGLAVLSTIAASQTRGDVHGGASSISALTSGFQLAFAVSAAVSLLGAVVAVVMLRPARDAVTGFDDVDELPVREAVNGADRSLAPARGRSLRGGGQRAGLLRGRRRGESCAQGTPVLVENRSGD